MTKYDSEHLIEEIKSLFPESKWGNDAYAVLIEQVYRFEVNQDQIRAVVRQYRASVRLKTPMHKDMIDRLRAAQGVRRPEKTPEVAFDWRNARHPMTGWNRELVSRYDANPGDPVFGRLGERGISVYVATRGERGTASGPAEVERARQ